MGERAGETVQRECLDHLLPQAGITSGGGPESALGFGVPETSEEMSVRLSPDRRRLCKDWKVRFKSVLTACIMEYRPIPCAA